MSLLKCKHLAIVPGERLSRNKSYHCMAQIPEMPLLPNSVTKAYKFEWPTRRQYVTVDHTCVDCQMYEARKK